MSDNVTKIFRGLHLDAGVLEQPKQTYRFALNGVVESKEGDMYIIANEEGTGVYVNLINASPMRTIGSIYVGDNEHLLILAGETASALALIKEGIDGATSNVEYLVVDTESILNFSLGSQVQGEYRLRNGCEKWVYFVDAKNIARTFNVSNPTEFQTGIEGLPLWNEQKFNLIKGYAKRPEFESFEIVPGGNLKSGTYNFAIQYVDENGNPTEWISVSMLVPIYVSNRTGNYDGVLGSSNPPQGEQNPLFGKPPANKSIKLILSNLDEVYPNYRIAVIEATSGDTTITRTLLSQSQLIQATEFIYDGNPNNYTEMSVYEVEQMKVDLGYPKHIAQAENRLLVANMKGSAKDLCSLQAYASKIRTKYVTKEAASYDYFAEGNAKNPNTMWTSMSAMGGEVYALGIVYIFDDDFEAPACHIPARNSVLGDREIVTGDDADAVTGVEGSSLERWRVYDTAVPDTDEEGNILPSGELAFWEAQNAVYPERTNCEGGNYWGVDADGIELVGKKIRHHRFPTRNTIPHATKDLIPTVKRTTRFVFKVEKEQEITTNYDYIISYTLTFTDGTTEDKEHTGSFVEDEFIKGETLYDAWYDEAPTGKTIESISDVILEPCTVCSESISVTVDGVIQGTCSGGSIFTVTITSEVRSYLSTERKETLNLIGVQFSNIELPPGVKGYYFVRAERDEFNRTVLDKAYSGSMREDDKYIAFTGFTESYFRGSIYTDDGTVYNSETVKYLAGPMNMFRGKENLPVYLKSEGYFHKLDGSLVHTTDMINGVDDQKSGMFDNDGFDWRGVFRVDNFVNQEDDTGYVEHNYSVKQSNILPPVSSKEGYSTDSNPQEKILYNCTFDNRIQIVEIDRDYQDVNPVLLADSPSTSYVNKPHQSIHYVALMVERDIHSNLDTIKYYKMHNNMQSYQDLGEGTDTGGVSIYGFDTFISHFPVTQSMFQGYTEETRILDYIVYAIVIIAAAIISIFTYGAGSILVIIAIAAIAAVGLTVTAVQTFTKDFMEGGLDTVMRDILMWEIEDDKIKDDMMHASLEHATGLFMESEINISLREEPNFGCSGPLTATDWRSVNSYFINKYLAYDVDGKEKHRIKPIPCPEFYVSNQDYQRMNKEKVFFPLSSDYDCCSSCVEDFPNRIRYSLQATSEEKVDSFGRFLPLDYIDIPGELGEITDIFVEKNTLYVRTEGALWLIPQNIQERVQGDVVSLVGTGGFFAAPPRKVFDTKIGAGGGRQKFATIKTKYGTVFVDDMVGDVYLLNFSAQTGTQVEELSSAKYGMDKWMKQNMRLFLYEELKKRTGEKYQYNYIPASPYGIGIHSAFDVENNRLLITKIDYQIHPNIVARTFAMYKDNIDTNNIVDQAYNPAIINSIMLNTWNGRLYYISWNGADCIATAADFDNTLQFVNRSFTLSFSFTTMSWISWHSYMPRKYIFDNNAFYSLAYQTYLPGIKIENVNKHNKQEIYTTYYGTAYPFIVEYPVVQNPTQTSIYDNIVIQTKAIKAGITKRYTTFNKMIVYNSRQCSGEVTLNCVDAVPTADYLSKFVKNTAGEAIIKEKDRNWIINDFRDLIVSQDYSLFLTDWDSIKASYFIDKVINPAAIDENKEWTDLEPFKDKYLMIRLIFDSTHDTKLFLNYLVESVKPVIS